MEQQKWLDEALYEYGRKDYYPFHMPGHKREFCPGTLKNPYLVDITEIDGFDNLHHAEGILLEAQQRAASLYGARETWYLVNGSTSGILAAVSACTSRGGEILMARNCHKAVYHAAYLRGLTTHYLFPEAEKSVGLNGGISPEAVREMLERYPGTEAVLITSPTYDGVVSDVKRIAKIAHAFHVPLIVDEAHGAHFPFSEYFPESALACGADVVIHSLHKTLPSLTQTALLHRNSERVSEEKLRRFLGIYQSSSPSYLFMAGMDACVRLIREKGMELFAGYTERLKTCRGRLAALKNLHLVSKDEILGRGFVYDLDESKILISTADAEMDGAKLHEILLERYHLQMEMAASQYVIALTSVMDTEDGFGRLEQALLDIDRETERTEAARDEFCTYISGEVCTSIAEAVEGDQEEIDLSDSEGRISSEYAYLYPPGIPFLVPGERISKDVLRQICIWKEQGLDIQGLNDYTLKKIHVLKDV